VTFLAINGINLEADPNDAVDFMVGVAAGTIDEQRCTEWIERHSAPRDS
jgi:prophage maintenance system killer protein